ncbi:MAG: biotin--[acetyl-CoA-carboxylase] ligase [Syntrophomonas sp.]|nr:biotin--[acetyl-CoA-carboxylase] ligase [Syntrophomonas sp.]
MSFRDAVLNALKQNSGQWLSGQKLCEILKVSRTTVWKQIKQLQAEGYSIQSSPKKGYQLSTHVDLLSPEEVCTGLTTKVLGRKDYFYYQQIDSTNNQARHLAAQGYPEGTLVIAEMQTEGRGRRGRTWYSPSGQGIYLSVILRPALPLKDISRVSLVTAVAVAETIKTEYNVSPCIKWPNDILINNRKIAGILSEAVTDMDGIEYIVAGIGLNINNSVQDFPSDFPIAATSARAEFDRYASRIQVLQTLLQHLEEHYFNLLNGCFAPTLERFKDMSMVIGQKLRLDTINGFITGQAIDIDENGFLLVCDHSGSIHTIMSGEISLI